MHQGQKEDMTIVVTDEEHPFGQMGIGELEMRQALEQRVKSD